MMDRFLGMGVAIPLNGFICSQFRKLIWALGISFGVTSESDFIGDAEPLQASRNLPFTKVFL